MQNRKANFCWLLVTTRNLCSLARERITSHREAIRLLVASNLKRRIHIYINNFYPNLANLHLRTIYYLSESNKSTSRYKVECNLRLV